ncbi:unnamed protein product [Paramecium pentaurelia]|uniref:Uncharacterized protein n=1 Tax=Paramecium pentaurelia TaxID=43138 RepID=A0A8S1UTS7_9CILI|nr:unnamed protein product [Paramecium pentaurelia]
MEIFLNGYPCIVPEYFTFDQLFQQTGQPGNFNNKNWQRNGLAILVNQKTSVKDFLQKNDQVIVFDKPQKLGSTIQSQQIGTFTGAQFVSPSFQMNQGTQQQKIIFLQNQNVPNQQFGMQQVGMQQVGMQQVGMQSMNVMTQGQQDYQLPQYNIQTNNNLLQNQNLYQQPIISQPQPQSQSDDYDVFQTFTDNNQNANEDIFSTHYQYSNYEQNRQKYLQTKSTCPGNKQDQVIKDNYRFTLDNYGDVLIIDKLDQSFYLQISNNFKLNKVRQFDIGNKQKQFESNIILDLNCTRVSWIQDLDLLAVQFNTGAIIAVQLYLE